MKVFWLILAGINVHTIWKILRIDAKLRAGNIVLPPSTRSLGFAAKILAAFSLSWCVIRIFE